MEEELPMSQSGKEKENLDRHQEDAEMMNPGGDADETNPMMMTFEGLLEENKALKATVVELRESLKKKNGKVRKQNKILGVLKWRVTRDEWNRLTKKLQTLTPLLTEALQEEEVLIEMVEGMKQVMRQAGQAVREKEEETRKLARKVSRLTEGGVIYLGRTANDNKMVQCAQKPALDILPEVVWETIFEKVSDPKDLWNCCNTCQLFETLLRPWKTGWMLEQALPYLYRHLSGSKLLECRLVSRGWDAGVNRFLDNHPSVKPYSHEDSDPRRLDVVYPVKEKGIGNRNFFNFGPDEDLSHLHELFPTQLARNPFIGRFVGLHLLEPDGPEDEDEVEERWAKLYSFLEAYGKDIWHLALYFPGRPGPRSLDKICELQTSKLFPLVPNLRKLFITETGYGMGMQRMEIDYHQLPPAPNLRIVQAVGIGLDNAVDTLLLKYHRQLEGLQVPESTWEFVRHRDWPNLKDLAIYMRRSDYRGHVEMKNLHGLRIPRLSRLTLRIDDFLYLELPSLVAVINELTLTTPLNVIRLAGPLHRIQLRHCWIAGEGWQPYVNAPFVLGAVKTLELVDHWSEGFSSLLCYNFLLCFPLIENLTVVVRKASSSMDVSEGRFEIELDMMPDKEWKRRAADLAPVDEFVEINKYAYVGQMYKSNIWELLPRLKVCTFQWDVYTRQGYEASKK